MNWNLWLRQAGAIVRLELTRYLKGRRWLGVYAVAFAPVLLLLVASRRAQAPDPDVYANLFQFFTLRFAIFISAIAVFTQLFRGEVLEKTLHFYLLAPARREIVAVGKYAAGAVFMSAVFGASTVLTYITMHSFMAEPKPPLVLHLVSYLAATVLACVIYGAACLVVGLMFKNPAGPCTILLGWEGTSFLLPPIFQRFSAVHYIQALLPVSVDRGPFAIVTEPPSALYGVPLLLIVTAALIAIAGGIFRFTQVTYSAD